MSSTSFGDLEREQHTRIASLAIVLGYRTAQEAQRDISHFLMHRSNWIRPHQFNDGLAPARAEEKLNVVSGIS